MTNTEFIAKIKAEIERLKAEHPVGNFGESFEGGYDAGYCCCCCEIADFLSTLESENPVPNDLEEAANKSSSEAYPYKDEHCLYDKDMVAETREYYKEGFIAGAKWDREQMMNEAVEGTIVYDYLGGYPAIKPNWLIGNIGDKVRVIVLKKED